MCFSAEASFSSSALLTVVGTLTLRKIHKPAQLVFAGITLFFAFQQFTEGVLWLVIPRPGHEGLQKAAAYAFLIMAEVVWPMLVPLSVLLLEESRPRRRLLSALLAVGLGIALFYLHHILSYPLHAEISGRHLIYRSAVQHHYGNIPTFVYLLPTLVPFYVSSLRRAYIMGVIMTSSFIVSALFYREHLTSVWCYFAAIMSFVALYIVSDSKERAALK